MERRTWAKIIFSALLATAIAVGIYFRWSRIGSGSDPLAAWGRGNPTLSERTYYVTRINRLIEEWAQSARRADRERDGRLKDSYRTLFVIDPDKQAVWIEENGQPRKNDYSELPPGMKWQFHHVTPEGNKELSGRIVLKMRGAYTRQQELEAFFLVGTGRGAGHFNFQFHPSGSGGGSYNSGSFRPQPFGTRSSKNSGDSYGSILVTDSEYARQRADGKIPDAQAGNWIEENEAGWLRVEKSLYGQIERQLRNAGYRLQRLKVEPGPDFSAGHAEVRGRSDSALRGFFGGSSSTEVYLKFDYLGDDIWYAKSARQHPQRPMVPGRTLDLEFLVHPTSHLADSQRSDLLAKGRKIQQSVRPVPSKWKATLPSGATVEFIGVCENPSAGKQWWGPDGSPVDKVPYVNTEPYGRPRTDRKIYEIAWRIKNPHRGGATTHWFERGTGSYYRQIRDRYGSHIIEDFCAEGFGFDKSRRKTTWTVGIASGDWQTALVVKDKAGETKFLDKQRIILNPPEIENGQIVVRCLMDSASDVRDYQTGLALIVWEDSTSKTVSIDGYREDVRTDKETGLTERKFLLQDVSMSQIEGVCFRYRPFEFVTFKNISLVPGDDQGFEIELGQ